MATTIRRAREARAPVPGAGVTQSRYQPWWSVWGPPAAVVSALGYGSLRLFWVLGERPWLPPTGDDLLAFSDWGAVVLCAGAALVSAVLAVTAPRGWALRGLVATGAVVVVGLLAASAVLLVDVVGPRDAVRGQRRRRPLVFHRPRRLPPRLTRLPCRQSNLVRMPDLRTLALTLHSRRALRASKDSSGRWRSPRRQAMSPACVHGLDRLGQTAIARG